MRQLISSSLMVFVLLIPILQAQPIVSLTLDTNLKNMTSSESSLVSGVVTYRQRIALPTGSVIEVKLLDVSKADAPAVTIAEQTIITKGEQVPIPFTLSYDSQKIDPRHTYAVQARILLNNQLRWINTTRYSVITQGNPTTVEVQVEPVKR